MGEINRCRKVHEKFIEFCPSNCEAWIQYAELEILMNEHKRTRALYEIAINQPILDMPELLWNSYINYECQYMQRKKARKLYERLLNKTQHIKVWLGYAIFEFNPLSSGVTKSKKTKRQNLEDETSTNREANARDVYERAFRSLREQIPGIKDEIVMILEAWYKFEKRCTTETHEKLENRLKNIKKNMPRRVKRKRILYTDNGTEVGKEEYWDYIFDFEKESTTLKLLETAYKWKSRHSNKF